MKNLTIVILGTLAITLFSCGGSSSGNAYIMTSSAQTSAATDDASFSCILDGKEVSGKGTDQNINAAFHLTGDDKGQIFFRLSDMNDTGDKLMFQVPAKEKTSNVTPNYKLRRLNNQ